MATAEPHPTSPGGPSGGAALKLALQDAMRWLRSKAHRVTTGGNTYACNFCGYQSDLFFPHGIDAPVFAEKQIVGGGRRANASCPRCGSTDRQRLVRIAIERFVSLPASPSILHMAPERRVNQFLRALPGARVTECDIDPSKYPWSGRVRAEDVTRFSFDDASFDLVLCSHILEHVPDDAKALAELFRVIRPGGYAILQVPYTEAHPHTNEDPAITDPKDRLARYGQEDHVRLYNRADFVRRAERAGFRSLYRAPDELTQFRAFAVAPNEGLLLFEKPRRNEPLASAGQEPAHD